MRALIGTAIVAFVAAFVAMTATSGKLLAQEDGSVLLDCGSCSVGWDGCGTGHITTSGGNCEGTGSHSSCKICLANGNEVPPNWCHGACSEDLTEEMKPVYQSILLAGRRGDISNILRLRVNPGGRIVFNSARMALQITACDHKTIIASLPIRTAEQLRLASALPAATGLATAANETGR